MAQNCSETGKLLVIHYSGLLFLNRAYYTPLNPPILEPVEVFHDA
jgi:hypothetical protein